MRVIARSALGGGLVAAAVVAGLVLPSFVAQRGPGAEATVAVPPDLARTVVRAYPDARPVVATRRAPARAARPAVVTGLPAVPGPAPSRAIRAALGISRAAAPAPVRVRRPAAQTPQQAPAGPAPAPERTLAAAVPEAQAEATEPEQAKPRKEKREKANEKPAPSIEGNATQAADATPEEKHDDKAEKPEQDDVRDEERGRSHERKPQGGSPRD